MNDSKESQLICRICGDKANGYNFNVLSCESCKAFFRRNAIKNMEFKCLFGGNCDIGKRNRKLCRCCRLKKCFFYGMKKEWILSDEQRKVRKSMKETNKVKRKTVIQMPKNNPIDSHWYNGYTSQDYNTVETKDNIYEMLDYNSDDNINGRLVESPSAESVSLETCSTASSPISDVSFFEPEEPKPDYSLVPVSRPITDYRNNLSEIEGRYLTELLNATNILKAPLGTITSEAITFYEALYVLYSARRIDIERFVSMSKNLLAFKDITEKDRRAIIKPGVIEMFYMRNVTGYFNDGQMQYLIVPTDISKSSTCLVRFDLFRQTKLYYYEANRNFYEKMAAEWDSDYVILDLMSAIVLFDPDRKCVTDNQAIRVKQHIYKYLLQRYLLLKYRTEEKAKEKYSKLLESLEFVHILLEKSRMNSLEENMVSGKDLCQLILSFGV